MISTQSYPCPQRTAGGWTFWKKELFRLIPEGIQYYPEDMVSDQPERVRAAEIIREKMLYALSDEIPHGIAVEVYEFSKETGGSCTTYRSTSSASGKPTSPSSSERAGEKLKAIASAARAELEQMLGCKVNLQCWIKVKEDWRNNQYLIRNYGYE